MCHGSTPASNQKPEKALALCELCSGSHKHISVLPTLFSAQVQNTAPHHLLWKKLTLPQPNPAHSVIQSQILSLGDTQFVKYGHWVYSTGCISHRMGLLRTCWQIIRPSDSASIRLPPSSVSRQTASVLYGKRLWIALRTFRIQWNNQDLKFY